MSMDTNIRGTGGAQAEVTPEGNQLVVIPGFNADGAEVGGGYLYGPAMFSEVDPGEKTGERDMLSPEVDKDYRLRVAHDTVMDQEQFIDTAQNTGKFVHAFTTLTATMSVAGLLTNSGNITTTTTGMTFGTFAFFPVGGTQTVVIETSVSFTNQPTSNVVIDFGLFLRGATTAFAPLDGFYFRLTSAGLNAVINIAGVETVVGPFPNAGGTGTWSYTNNSVNRFLIQANNVSTTFWINNDKYAEIATPAGAAFPCQARALPWSVRHAIVGGAAGAALQANFRDYRVLVRGPQYSDSLGVVNNRVLGSYQGLSGGTMGSLANYANSANPTAAVPTNTTAALGTGLGGQFWETFTLAVNTDGIICSYQVPAGTTAVQGRRLRISAVSCTAYVQTVLAGGPCVTQFSLAFGHTAVSLATAETGSFVTATTKAPRRVALPALSQIITANQAVSTAIAQPGGYEQEFSNPIFVNPGEFIALVAKHVGTVGTSGTIAYVVSFDYAWE